MSIIYFILVSVSWGLTWYAIKIHAVSAVPAEQSIGYRFLLASSIVYLFCRMRKISLTHTLREHLLLAGQGLCMCSINFYFCYLAARYIPSGLVSIGFATLVFMNVLNNKIFFKTPVSLQTVLGGCIGLVGMMLVFAPYFSEFQANANGLFGVLLCLGGTYIASIGNMLVRYNHNPSKSVIQNIVPTMFYGGIFSFCISIIQGGSLKISFDPQYIGALLYLVVFGSLIGFVSYLKLIKSIGSDKAAYSTMVNPVIALSVSSFLEGLNWTLMTISGVFLILFGSIIVLSNFKRKQRAKIEKPQHREAA